MESLPLPTLWPLGFGEVVHKGKMEERKDKKVFQVCDRGMSKGKYKGEMKEGEAQEEKQTKKEELHHC